MLKRVLSNQVRLLNESQLYECPYKVALCFVLQVAAAPFVCKQFDQRLYLSFSTFVGQLNVELVCDAVDLFIELGRVHDRPIYNTVD